LSRVRELEACTLRAWPAAEEEHLGGWTIRCTGGYTRRANSVFPLGSPGEDPEAAIARAEEWFRGRGQRPIFKLTSEPVPADLDARLEARGWSVEAEALVMVRPAGSDPAPPDPATELPARPGPEWLACFEAWNRIPADRVDQHRGILGRIACPAAFALRRDAEGRAVACGLAVADIPWVGLYDLVTEPGQRGRGHGTALVSALLDWGGRHGCDRAYLQVEVQNRSARSLYERLGFADDYPYWYRIGP
jgi:GNAT superfamily N-acetyltransferase